MKRLTLLFVALCGFVAAQSQVADGYGPGAVPTRNKHVTFEKTVEGEALATIGSDSIFQAIQSFTADRLSKPAVINSKVTECDAASRRVVVNVEEYITFRNSFLVLDRTRINYWLEIQATDNGYNLKMTRIKYWYDEERGDGERFSAEESIVDEYSLKAGGTKPVKAYYKFRVKTIDLFQSLNDNLNARIVKP